MDADTAERITSFLAHQDGITAATVGAYDGSLLATTAGPEGAAEAALAAFVCERAAEVTSEDDLRGMGKLVSESAFERLAISGPRGDALVLALDGACVLVSARVGQLGTAEQSVAPVISRYGPAAASSRGG